MRPKRRKFLDATYNGACRRALANAITYQRTYYIRPDATGGGYNITDVEPDTYTVKAVPKLHNPQESELRNQENWLVRSPEVQS